MASVAFSSPSTVVFFKVFLKDSAARDEFLSIATRGAEFALENEPDVLTYAVCEPSEITEDNENTVYVIEQYASKAALEFHTQSGAVAEIASFLRGDGSDEVPTRCTPQMVFGHHALPPHELTDRLRQAEDPTILWAEIKYKEPEELEKDWPHWERIVNDTRSEHGCLLYAAMTSRRAENAVYAYEVYTSAEALKEHSDGEALKGLFDSGVAKTSALYNIKKVAGFLLKPEDVSKPSL